MVARRSYPIDWPCLWHGYSNKFSPFLLVMVSTIGLQFTCWLEKARASAQGDQIATFQNQAKDVGQKWIQSVFICSMLWRMTLKLLLFIKTGLCVDKEICRCCPTWWKVSNAIDMLLRSDVFNYLTIVSAHVHVFVCFLYLFCFLYQCCAQIKELLAMKQQPIFCGE